MYNWVSGVGEEGGGGGGEGGEVYNWVYNLRTPSGCLGTIFCDFKVQPWREITY